MTILNATEARSKPYHLIDEAAITHRPIVITGKQGNAVLEANPYQNPSPYEKLYESHESSHCHPEPKGGILFTPIRAFVVLSSANLMALAYHIIDDLDTLVDENVDRLWLEEAQRRYQAYVAGETKAKPAQEVFERVRRRLQQ